MLYVTISYNICLFIQAMARYEVWGDVIYCLRYVNTYSFCSYVIELCKKGTSALAVFVYKR